MNDLIIEFYLFLYLFGKSVATGAINIYMQKVTIKKEGIFFSFWDEQTASWIDRNILDSDFPISHYLPYSTRVEGEITVRDLLKHLSHFRTQIQPIFANALSGITCDQMADLIESPKKPNSNVPMNVIYLFKMGEVIPVKDEEIDYLSTYSVLMGLFVEENVEEDKVYHLSAFDVRDWVDLPFAIDNFMEYTDVETEEVLLNGLIDWKFFEIIHAVLNQITLTFQVMQMTSTVDLKKLESGPMLIGELFVWIDELDRIFAS